MSWTPLPEVDLWDMINAASERMTLEQSRLWEIIKIDPQKWSERTYGELGGGFWAVAVIGNSVIWFNDIEDGFNRSTYTEYGEIAEYLCNQDKLEVAVQNLVNHIKDRYFSGGRTSPPKPMA